jgi:hypothetical protein
MAEPAGSVVTKKVLFYGSLLAIFCAIVFLNVIIYNDQVRYLLLGNGSVGLSPPPKKAANGPDRNPTNFRRILNPALLAPGTALFGASIDWEAGDLPVDFGKRFGRPLAVVQYFLSISNEVQKVKEFKYIVDSVARVDGAVLALTVKPSGALESVTDAAHDQVGRVCKFVNDLGVPIILRWGHEMNGNWYPYGQRPALYREHFRKAAVAIRKYTNLTWMMWAPNNPSGYPWTQLSTKLADADRLEMDTNKDGLVNENDDPFTPYYPGDQYVDWIGYSVFHFGGDGLTGNSIPSEGQFNAVMDFKAGETAKVRTWNCYRDFSQLKNKPFGLMETAGTYYPKQLKAGDPTALQIKRAWWRQVYSSKTLDLYPLMKIIMWFDIAKYEDAGLAPQVYRDFHLSYDSAMVKEFFNDLPKDRIFFGDSKDSDLPLMKEA